MGNLGSGSGSSYPSTLDTQTAVEVDSPAAGKTKARAAVPNDIIAAVIAIEAELGTLPKGSTSNVKTFLQVEHNTDGTHNATAGASGSLGVLGRAVFATSYALAVGSNTTEYMHFSGKSELPTSDATVVMLAPFAGNVKSLYAKAQGGNSLNGATVVTLRKNSADTALTVTITAGSTAVFSDTTNSVSFVAGDLLNWKIDTTASSSGAITGPMLISATLTG